MRHTKAENIMLLMHLIPNLTKHVRTHISSCKLNNTSNNCKKNMQRYLAFVSPCQSLYEMLSSQPKLFSRCIVHLHFAMASSLVGHCRSSRRTSTTFQSSRSQQATDELRGKTWHSPTCSTCITSLAMFT